MGDLGYSSEARPGEDLFVIFYAFVGGSSRRPQRPQAVTVALSGTERRAVLERFLTPRTGGRRTSLGGTALEGRVNGTGPFAVGRRAVFGSKRCGTAVMDSSGHECTALVPDVQGQCSARSGAALVPDGRGQCSARSGAAPLSWTAHGQQWPRVYGTGP